MGRTERRPRARSKTRSDKPRLLESGEENLIKVQLASRGLMISNVAGDGNCMFRALSDQIYGNPNQHAQIRESVCSYLAQNEARYKLFVDEDSVRGGFDGHVETMRQAGTYGTHIELVVAANLFGRPINITQPGLIYVIDTDEQAPLDDAQDDPTTSRRSSLRGAKPPDPPRATEPIYLVYHSWEHYSSVRNIAGPSTGLPYVREGRMVQEASDEEEPTATDKLILNSLPSSQRRTVSLAEIRRLTRSEGSWEAATELLITKFNASEQERVKSLQAQLEAEKLAAEVSSPEAAVEEKPPEKVILRLRGRPRKTPVVPPPDASKSLPNLHLPSTSGQALTIPAIDSLRGHRARSLSLSGDESSESPRQRSRRDSPISAASFGSASSTEASSVSNEEVPIPDRTAPQGSDSAVATRLRNSTLPKVKVEAPIPPKEPTKDEIIVDGEEEGRETRSGATKLVPKRGPTSREKKDIQRRKKAEAKSIKGKKKVANKLRRGGLPGELLTQEIVITTRVKELYI